MKFQNAKWNANKCAWDFTRVGFCREPHSVISTVSRFLSTHICPQLFLFPTAPPPYALPTGRPVLRTQSEYCWLLCIVTFSEPHSSLLILQSVRQLLAWASMQNISLFFLLLLSTFPLPTIPFFIENIYSFVVSIWFHLTFFWSEKSSFLRKIEHILQKFQTFSGEKTF